MARRVVKIKDEIKLILIKDFENINYILKLDDHMGVVPITFVIGTIFKPAYKWRLSKFLFFILSI